MSKYSVEFKLKVVIAVILHCVKNIRFPLLHNYENGLININSMEKMAYKKLVKRKYSGESKLGVLKYRQVIRLSYKETTNLFEISQGSTIANWQPQYNEEGLDGLNRLIGRS